MEEQHRIADFLDTRCAAIDDVRSDTEREIALLKEYKQALITQTVTRGLNPDASMKDSGVEWIGEIPEEWEVVALKYLCDIKDECRMPIAADKRSNNADVLYDYYGASGVIDKIDGYTIDDHVLLVGEDGANLLLRNLPLVYEVNGKAWINNHAHIIKPHPDMHFNYVFNQLESVDLTPYITGSAQPKLTQDALANIPMVHPPLPEQRAIADFLDTKCSAIDDQIADLESELATLDEYKKSLIYNYVTGKKEVPVDAC